MARRSEIITVYAAGVVQGIALVTFPAASAVFTSPSDYGFSGTEYGGMFLPQAITAIVSALLGAGLRSRLGTKRLFMLGLCANFLAMSLLVASRFVMREHSTAYGILLVATACMGVGFGFTVPALNTLAAAFFPQKTDRAILVLNALLGLGTALAPVFIAIFSGLGIWWGLPLLAGALVLTLLCFGASQPLKDAAESRAKKPGKKKAKIPARFWVFAAFALLYGICETMNGTWASPYMTKQLGASPALASAALAAFWGMATAGRVLFAAVEKWVPEKMVCRILPFAVAASFVVTACVPKSKSFAGVLAFALAGLSCSALLPLTISFGQKELAAIAASAAGGLIAFYQLGYGIAAFGVGPLQKWTGLGLGPIYAGTAVVAIAMAVLSLAVTKQTRAPS